MAGFTGSGGITIELDKRYYREFRSQLRAASTDLEDHNAEFLGIMREALRPLVDEWRWRLPGSLKGTVKSFPSTLTVRAGFASTQGGEDGRPFLPWLEFGGTVVWKQRGTTGYTHLPLQSRGFRNRFKAFIERDRVAEGRWRGPAVKDAMPRVQQETADGVQRMLEKVFHAP